MALRPVRESDLDLLTFLNNDPEGASSVDWYGWRNPADWRRRWSHDGLIGDRDGTLIITASDNAGAAGFCNWRMNQTRTYSYNWSVGVVVAPHLRGQGIGTQALVEVTEYLFATSPVHRVEAETDSTNVASQKIIEKAGYQQEGCLRGIVFRDGRWRDYLLYSRLRTDAALDPVPVE